jgi:hypothetical protein
MVVFSLAISFTKLSKCAIGGLTKTRLIGRKSTVDIFGHQNLAFGIMKF